MIHDTRDLRPNGGSMQIYFAKDMATETLVPFDPGGQAHVFVLPYMGFLVLSPHAVQFPLEIRDPRDLQNGSVPADVVDPLIRPTD